MLIFLEMILLGKRRVVQNKTFGALTPPKPLTCYFLCLHLALMANSIEKELVYPLFLFAEPRNFSY